MEASRGALRHWRTPTNDAQRNQEERLQGTRIDDGGGEYELFASRKGFEDHMFDFTNRLHSR